MHALLERPLLALAWAAAVVLLALGVRRLRISDRRGLFLTALSFFLALQGVAPSVAAAEDPKAAGDRVKLPLPPELSEGAAWEKFKDLWRRMDAVVPRAEDGALAVGGGSYTMAVEPEQQEIFRTELAGILGIGPGQIYQLRISGPPQKAGAVAPGAHLSTLGQVLAVLALKRIDHMGMDQTMMMRMVPPPTLQFRGSVVEQIERRIDSLMALRAKDAVTAGELDAALVKLQNDVWVHSILAVFDDHRLGYFGPAAKPGAAAALPDPTRPWGDQWFDAASWLRGFEETCAPKGRGAQAAQQAQRDDEGLRSACRTARDRLELLRGVRKDLDRLIEALETP